ncbi:MAG: tetratricopeptide repeat protein, partial [Chloroflexi bacterium]
DLEPVLTDKTLLLTFDEFDNLEERGVKEELARPLVDYLRRLMGRAGINFIFSIGSSGRKLENMQAGYTEFFKSALYKKISFLSQEQTHQLITRPVKGLLEYDRAAVDRILDLASGHPYFTQLTCHELFARCQRTQQRAITLDDVEAVLDDVVERGTVNLKFIWDEASDIEKWSVAALAHTDKADSRTLVESLRRERVRFSESDLTSGLLHLREKDVLSSDNRFVIQLLKRWLQKNRPIEQVREELTEVNPIANRLIEIGLEYRDSGQYQKAIENFQEALAVAKDNIQAQVNIALTYMDQKLHEKAVLEFEKALAIDDEDVAARAGLCEAHLALGDTALSKGYSKDAVESYRRVLTINVEHTEALQRLTEIYSQRAETARQAGRAQEALDALREALKFSPQDPGLIARVAELQGEMREREIDAMLTRIDIAVRLSRWDEAYVALMAYLNAKPIKGEEGELSEGERLRREALWVKIQNTAHGLEGLEKYDEALKLWRNLMSRESGSLPFIESELARLEEKRELAKLYKEAKYAIFQNDHSLAAKLLKDIVLRDETYKDVLQLLTQVTARRRASQKAIPLRWMRVVAPIVLTAAFISLVVILWSSSWFQALFPSMEMTTTPTVARIPSTAAVSPTPDLRSINPANQ